MERCRRRRGSGLRRLGQAGGRGGDGQPRRPRRRGVRDSGLLGAAALRLAGLARLAESGSALAGGVDADGDGRKDVLVGHRRSYRGRGSASLVLTPALPARPVAPPLTGTLRATNVEASVDDSPSMRLIDPDGLMRRQALELMLVNPANADRWRSRGTVATPASG